MKISLVTICFNSEATIRDTFDSVLAQTYDNIEYVIKDGLSKDSTNKIIKEYLPKFKKKGIEVNYVSNSDKGLYDAMNIGVSMCTGDIIGIINSDDIIHDKDAFKKIAKRFKEDKCDATYSDLYIMDYETMSIPSRIFIAGKKSYKLGWYPPHPTLYVRREVYEKYGNYDTKYRIAADYDFMVRIMKQGIKLSYIKEPLIYMRAGGTSTSSLKSYKKSFDEAIDVLKKNKIKCVYPVNFLRTFVIFKQMFMGKFKIGFKK